MKRLASTATWWQGCPTHVDVLTALRAGHKRPPTPTSEAAGPASALTFELRYELSPAPNYLN
jgi:hypothetical protein